MRDVAADYAALALAQERAKAVGGLGAAFAGDDQHSLVALGVSCEQEGAQACPGIALARPVQIEARVDLYSAGGNLAGLATVEIGERRRRARRLGLGDCGDAGFARSRNRLAARRCTLARLDRCCHRLGRRGHSADTRLAFDWIQAAGRMPPEPGLVRGDTPTATARLLASPAHCRAFSGALPDAASARAGTSLGSSTTNLPGCLVTPANRPA